MKGKCVRVQDSLRWRRPDAGSFRLFQRVSSRVPSRKRKDTGSGRAKTWSELNSRRHAPTPASSSSLPATRKPPASRYARARAHIHTHARALLSYGHSQTQRFLSHLFQQPGLRRPPRIGTPNPHVSEKRGSTTLQRKCTQPMRVRSSTESAEGQKSLRWLGLQDDSRKSRRGRKG